jgi:hypothetical protein
MSALSEPVVMGVVNVTPDSFSDGGLLPDPAAAIAHGRRLLAEGAGLLDVGGESTRPGAEPVDPGGGAARVVPVVAALAREPGARVSIDTMKLAVAEPALGRGRLLRQRRHGVPPRPRARGASWPTRARTAASCTCSASRAPCSATRATATWSTT